MKRDRESEQMRKQLCLWPVACCERHLNHKDYRLVCSARSSRGALRSLTAASSPHNLLLAPTLR